MKQSVADVAGTYDEISLNINEKNKHIHKMEIYQG